jgi:hypothetical protein
LLHPTQDTPVDNGLLTSLLECLRIGIRIALVTGSSIRTVQDYVLNPIRDLKIRVNDYKLYVYTETGCNGYIISDALRLVPLQNYEVLTMDQHMLASILDALQFLSGKSGIKGEVRVRNGQVNFYCIATREDRIRFAMDLETYFFSKGIGTLNMIVPSAKSAIDISLSTKKRAILDLKRRIGLVGFKNVIFISDSLQVDGSDSELLFEMPEATAFHVGPHDAPVYEGVVSFEGGPDGTREILNYVLSLL